ncbi:TadE-like protein [Nocardioides terrae]|uniref:TadE-like protein n=1 Tax=Nocardioides terrae TaxID=574651 RepID=A0A1I1J587_9ACTN|nr:TadE family protein [Nocardioides terrae]SFC43779.1 TadE-like protein [Nocardioides terrae]
MRTLTRSDTRGAVATGAVVFEAALLTPLLVVIMLGIVEMALLMRDNVALNSLIHTGGKAATSFAVDADRPAATVADAPATTLSDLTASAIEQAKTTLSKDSISELWVYEANPAGFPLRNGTDHFARCDDGCAAYAWDADAQEFHRTGGRLGAHDIDACGSSFGVYVKANHSFLTGVFQGVTITKHETFQLGDGADCRVATS